MLQMIGTVILFALFWWLLDRRLDRLKKELRNEDQPYGPLKIKDYYYR